jgi:NADPH:quinone reductase-like Zn-dependent oxidoreductase
VREHGAAEVVDYTKENLLEHFKDAEDSSKFDVIYDAATGSGAGEDYKAQSLQLLRSAGERHGQYVAINGAAGMWLRHFTIGQKKDQHLVLMDVNTADLEHLATLDLKPVIARQLPLSAEAVKEGFELLRSRRAVGKIVFDMSL